MLQDYESLLKVGQHKMKISKVDIESLRHLEDIINSYKKYFTLLHRQRCLCEEHSDVIHEASKQQNEENWPNLKVKGT